MPSFIPRLCSYCNNTFKAPLSEVNRGRGIFCSRKCFFLSVRTIDIKKNCDYCKKEFRITSQSRKDARFCSRPCYYIGSRAETFEARKILDKRCGWCNKLIPFKKDYLKRQYCCISCASKASNKIRAPIIKEKNAAKRQEIEGLKKEITRLKGLLND